jgi:hypothetical protein
MDRFSFVTAACCASSCWAETKNISLVFLPLDLQNHKALSVHVEGSTYVGLGWVTVNLGKVKAECWSSLVRTPNIIS